MKPCSRSVRHSGILLQDIGFGIKNTVASIKGSTEKLGRQYQNALVVLYNKNNFHPIAFQKPNPNGNYEFFGLNNSTKLFVVAFDNNKQYNAVVQDNVVAK